MIIDRPKSDPLSQVVALLRPQPLSWRVMEAHAPWSIRFPATDIIVFGQLIEGPCQVTLADRAPIDFQRGDFLLMPAPSAWTMGTSGHHPPVDLMTFLDSPGMLLSSERDPAITRFMAGAFVFAAPNAGLLAGLMPSVIHVRGAEVAAERLGALLKLAGDEALADRAGRSLVLDRLLEIILVDCLRHRPAGFAEPRRGLIAALEDAQIGAALRLMYADVRRPWTVGALAREVGMSRSAFAARFAETVGSPPIDYLLNWRISLAKSALTSSKRPMSEIADLAGYQSVSAFSTAFSRATGTSPTAYIRASAS